jgi:hypothetical protein
MKYPSVGLRNVGSYQISGHPYMTGAAMAAGEEYKISFPYVTKKITVTFSGSIAGAGAVRHARVTFVPSGSAGDVIDTFHYAFFDGHEDSQEFDVRCKELYVSTNSGATLTDAAFFVYASLTTIPTSSMYALTGSGLTDAYTD